MAKIDLVSSRFVKWAPRSDLSMPRELVQALSTEPTLCWSLMGMDSRQLRERDSARVDELDVAVKRHFDRVGTAGVYDRWGPVSEKLREFCQYGTTGPGETVAAMILAGAGMHRTDIPVVALRAGLSRNLVDACGRFRAHAGRHAYADGYAKLNLAAGTSVLASRIEALLKGQGVPVRNLRLGKDLSSLDPEKIEQYRLRFFGTDRRVVRAGTRYGSVTQDSRAVRRRLFAPSEVQLTLAKVICDQQQEPGGDEIFFVSYFTHPADVGALYQQIDQAIRSGTLGDVPLTVNPVTDVCLTPVSSYKTGDAKALNCEIGKLGLVQGFGPWHCSTTCYEDDDGEYKAVQEVLDKISEYAGYVQQGATVVASVSGPTVVAAGAAAVAAGAEYVRVCAQVGSAVVGIVNFFDENDLLGTNTAEGRGDYLDEKAGDFPFPQKDIGLYKLEVTERRVGQCEVQRRWEGRRTSGRGGSHTHDAGGLPGIKEDDHVSFEMNADTDLLDNWGVEHECLDEGSGGDRGHSEWKAAPALSNRRTVAGTIHMGQSGYGKIRATPWATGLGQIRPL
jgi:hypothetical protein